MSTVIGSVSFVEGLAVAVAPDGTERVLALGDQVMADEVIRTGPDANVEIRVLSGEPVVLAAGQSWLAVEAGMATAGQEAGVGVVSLTSGQVVAVAADGSERVLMAGDVIYADEVIRTSPDGHVDITMRSGNPVTLSGGQSWLATADTYTPADQFDTSEATADVAALQQAILAGQDPTEILEPTAAGETAASTPDAGNEGADFIQLERTAGETTPEAGYDTIGQGYSLMTPIAEEPILIKQSVAVPVMASDLENNQLVIDEDGSGSFSVTAAAGEASDFISQIAISNLPTGASVSGSDGGSYDAGTGIYTTSGNPSSVTLTIAGLTPTPDSDVDLGSIGFTATAQDSSDSSLTSSTGTSVSVITDAVLDQYADLSATAQSVNESNSGAQTLNLGASMTLASTGWQNDGGDSDGSEHISITLSLNSPLPAGVTLSSSAGTLTPVSGSDTDYTLTAHSGSSLSAAVAGLQATVPQGWDGVISGSLTSVATDTPTGGSDVEPDTSDNSWTDTADFSLTVVPDPILIVGTNVSDDYGSTEPFAVSPDSGSFGAIEGGGAGDILIGDTGGVDTIVVPGTNYNIALIVDVSGSMDAGSGTYENGHELTRLELLQKALVNMAAQLADHDGTINIALIPFAGASSTSVSLSIQDLNAGNLSQLTDAINALSADGGTNYEAAFNTAVDWFNGSDVDSGATNLTYFLTDGNPTYYLDDNDDQRGTGNTTSAATLLNSVDAFAGLSNVSEVHGIGIGTGINEEYLTFFDNTDLTGTHSVSIGTSSINGPGGEVDVVQTEDELNAALQSGSVDQDLTATGDDLITGNDGDDILFGDSINTDVLADNQGLTTLDGTGWAVFEALENGQGTDSGWNRAETLDYIRDHHAELAVEGQDSSNQGRDGGNDILYGGAGNDILYGQEGDDELYGGAGDDLLNGGSGSDTFVWQNGDQGEGGAVAQDVIQGFDRQGEGDSIDLSDLLQGEDGNDITALLNFVSVTEVGGDTVISVSHDGGAAAGVDQTITLQGVSLADLGVADSNASQAQILDTLVDNGTLTVDQS